MMKTKKVFTIITILTLLLTGILAGCSSSNEEADKGKDQGTAQGEKVQITLAGWGSSPEETKLFNQTLDAFKEKNPNIDVKFEVIADQYMDVMKTRLVGGQAADVFFLDAFEAPGLIETGVLEPLDDYVTDDFDVNDFEKPMLDAFKGKDGNIYGFPKDFSTLALFYNKKMFADAGIKNPPTTWDELREISKKLTKGTEVYGFGVAPELARLMYVAQSTGDQVVKDDKANFASDKAVNALQPIVDQHVIDKTSAQPSEVGADWGGDMFGQGKAAMVIEGPWAIPFLESNFPNLDYATAEVPTINGNKGTMAYTVAYVMNKESKNKEAAWKLISFLTGKEGMKIWTSKGIALPTRKSVAAELGFDKDPLRAPMIEGAGYATVWQGGANLPIIMNNFNNQFVSAFLGDRPLNEALKEAQDQANNEIQANQ
ncbi:sugar transporter [Tepidibacillus decaturensis]|uniref:Sugar transporter n=2 Tax=Tepidibacillus decaturensis TaxID=1413211 RepID=A0A135L4N1_9BACI|nr:ABC transporter substrate-binding protein [Tepidibacillus decaturensis]KXG43890.1 sugar transporter [Tepidibacillus decaturensis]